MLFCSSEPPNPSALLLDGISLLQSLLEKLGQTWADLLDLLDQVFGVGWEEFNSGLDLVLDLLGLASLLE
jgi:hypothetical protein